MLRTHGSNLSNVMKEILGLFPFTDFSFCVTLLMFLGTCPGLKTVQVDVNVEFCA